MNRTYDSSLRLDTLIAKDGANSLQAASYAYDGDGRLQSLGSPAGSFTCHYRLGPVMDLLDPFFNTLATSSRLVQSLDRASGPRLITRSKPPKSLVANENRPSPRRGGRRAQRRWSVGVATFFVFLAQTDQKRRMRGCDG